MLFYLIWTSQYSVLLYVHSSHTYCAGSTAGGRGELDSVKDSGGKGITDAIQQAADEAQSS